MVSKVVGVPQDTNTEWCGFLLHSPSSLREGSKSANEVEIIQNTTGRQEKMIQAPHAKTLVHISSRPEGSTSV